MGQEPVLFAGSIRDNIAYGLPNCSEEDVVAAAREADALGFIEELEGGFAAGWSSACPLPCREPRSPAPWLAAPDVERMLVFICAPSLGFCCLPIAG